MDNNINNNLNPEITPENIAETAAEAVEVVEASVEAAAEADEAPVEAAAEAVEAPVEAPVEAAVEAPAATVAEAAAEVAAAAAVAQTAADLDIPKGFCEPAPVEVIEPTGDIEAQTQSAAIAAAAAAAAPVVYTAPGSKKTDMLSAVGFVLGLLSLIMAWTQYFCYACILFAIAALVICNKVKKEVAEDKLAKAGVVLGIIGLILSCLTSISCAACGSMSTDIEDDLESYLSENGYSEADLDEFQQFLEEYQQEYNIDIDSNW